MPRLSWPIAVLTLALLITLSPLLVGRFYAMSDMRDVFIPLELFFHQQELQGHLPSWNPNAAFGYPVIAAAQIGFFYPPLLLLRLLPIQLYLPIILFTNAWVLAIGCYLFLRSQKFSQPAAFFGTLSFAFSAFIWQHLTHLNIFLSIAWLPWQFLLAYHLSQKPIWKFNHSASLALAIGIPFLIGQLQIQTFSTLVVFAYILYVRGVKQLKSTTISLAVIAVTAFLIASAQLLPTYELVKFSSRGNGGNFDIQTANQYSFPLYHLQTFIFPRFYGSDDTYWGKHLEIEYGVFIGTLPLLLALLALYKTKPWRQPASQFFWWLLVVSALLALGSLSPFRLLKIEPTLWIFSSPSRWLLFTTLALSYFAAVGFDTILPTISKKYWQYTAYILGVFVIIWNALIFWPINITNLTNWLAPHATSDKADFITQKVTSLLHSAQTSSVSLTYWWTYLPFVMLAAAWLTHGKKHAQKTILAVTIVELILVAGTTTGTLSWPDILSAPSTVAHLPAEITKNQARVYSIREGGDTGHYFTDPQSRANASIRAQQKKLLVPLLNSQFNIPGVEWPASLDIQAVSNALSSMRGDSGYDIKNPDVLGQLNIGAVMIPQSLSASVPGVLVSQEQGINLFVTPHEPRAELITVSGEHIPMLYVTKSATQTLISTPVAGTLIIRDTWYPGWQATIDGVPVPVTQTPPFFRQITIPAGIHNVVLTYQPTTINWGITLSLLTILLCSATLILRRPQPTL